MIGWHNDLTSLKLPEEFRANEFNKDFFCLKLGANCGFDGAVRIKAGGTNGAEFISAPE
jgi:hypothetical protein